MRYVRWIFNILIDFVIYSLITVCRGSIQGKPSARGVCVPN